MTVTKSDRKKQIIKHVKDNPFCTRDSLFTNGKIEKSKATNNILDELITKNKVSVTLSEKGKPRYFIELKTWGDDLKWKKTQYDVRQLRFILLQQSKRLPSLQDTFSKFDVLLVKRMNVLKFERKYAEQFNEIFTPFGMVEILQRFQELLSTKEPFSSEIEKITEWINFEISRDEYYLSHEAKATTILSEKYHSEDEKMRNLNKQFWIRKERNFQKIKSVRKMRSVYETIEISEDRYKYGLSRPNQIYHERRLKREDSENEFDEIFKRLYAEHHRILYRNPEITESQIMIMVSKKRLDVIDQDHSKSKDYKQETKNLNQFIRELESNPTELHNLK